MAELGLEIKFPDLVPPLDYPGYKFSEPSERFKNNPCILKPQLAIFGLDQEFINLGSNVLKLFTYTHLLILLEIRPMTFIRFSKKVLFGERRKERITDPDILK